MAIRRRVVCRAAGTMPAPCWRHGLHRRCRHACALHVAVLSRQCLKLAGQFCDIMAERVSASESGFGTPRSRGSPIGRQLPIQSAQSPSLQTKMVDSGAKRQGVGCWGLSSGAGAEGRSDAGRLGRAQGGQRSSRLEAVLVAVSSFPLRLRFTFSSSARPVLGFSGSQLRVDPSGCSPRAKRVPIGALRLRAPSRLSSFGFVPC